MCLLVVLNMPVSFAENINYELEYDAAGNLIRGMDKRYEYDEFNQLQRVLTVQGDVLEEYFYGQNGNRIKKIEHLPDNQLQTTYYPHPSLVQVVNQQGVQNTHYYYDDKGVLLARKDSDGRKYYYHPDLLGSTTLITDEQGNEVEDTTYLPFGEVLEGGEDRFLYTGKEKDRTQLLYFGARYYDPVLKKFTSPDTTIPDIYNPQQLNRYSYVLNNPYRYTDPDGRTPWDIIDIGLFALDVKAVMEDPSLANVGWATLSGVSLLPILPNVAGYVRYGGKIGKIVNIGSDTIKTTTHGYQHYPKVSYPIKQQIKRMKDRPKKSKALYFLRQGEIENLEREAWEKGTQITKDEKIWNAGYEVGASKGKKTTWIRMRKYSSDTPHGQPITEYEAKELLNWLKKQQRN